MRADGVEPDRSAAGGHRAPRSPPRPRRDPAANFRLRRLPHRPACGGRRTARAALSRSSPAMKSSARVDMARPRRRAVRRSASASACPGSATPASVCAFCPTGHENLCDHPRFTGYQRDGGYADYDHSRRALRLSTRRGWRRLEPRAAALRRADRLAAAPAHAPGGGERLGLYGFGAAAHIHCAGRAPSRAAACSPSPGRAITDGQSFRPRARRGLGRRLRPGAAGIARRRDHLRPGRPAGAAALRAVRKGGARGLRRHPHERYSELSLRAAVGGARAALRSPT